MTIKDKIEKLLNSYNNEYDKYLFVYYERVWFNKINYYTVINWKQRDLWRNIDEVEYKLNNSYDFWMWTI